MKFSNKFRSEGIDVLTWDKANWRGTGRYRNQDSEFRRKDMGEFIESAKTEMNVQDEPGELIQISQAMLADVRADLNNVSTKSIPIASLSSLGAGIASLVPALRTVTETITIDGVELYKWVNKGAGDTLKSAKDGSVWGSYKTADGASKMAKFEPVDSIDKTTQTVLPMNLATMLMAFSICAIEKHLNVIEDMQQQIMSFLETEKESEIEADVKTLSDLMEKYKYNWDNEYFISSNHKLVLDIQRTALKNMYIYQKQTQELLRKKKVLVAQANVETIFTELKKKFSYYRLALYTYSLASLFEIMLSGNFKEENVAIIKNKICGFASEYRELFGECSIYLEKLGRGAIDTNILKGVGNTGKKLGNIIGSIPIISKGSVDELLERGGRHLSEQAGKIEEKSVHDFASLGNPGTSILTEKMQDIIDIYNHTESICFDSERIYLIETSA